MVKNPPAPLAQALCQPLKALTFRRVQVDSYQKIYEIYRSLNLEEQDKKPGTR
jgi:hypothetical protein